MKNSHCLLGTSGVAAAVLLYSLGAAVFAQDEPRRPINPGLVPNTGQINTGAAPQPWSKSAEVDNIPAPAEAWAALVQPIPGNRRLAAARRRRGLEANSRRR